MIKLNNKNITYVAFADTNNSIKAPKEVWYADSANSVKLVYRRKDALIEGEDYEKYHWLVADTPYGTNIELPLDTANFSFKRIWRDFGNDTLFLSNSKQYVYHAATKNIYIWSIPNNNDIFIGNTNRIRNEETIIYSSDGNLMVGDEEVPQIDYPPSIIRFRNAGTDTTQYSTSVITVDGTKRYIPCKLLKPVPKWLDANGIRRQVGECGMIDLVSGKFYGNVNSNGTFTVENYYERKEWLQGRNGAYINTNHKLVTIEDKFDVKARWDGELTRENDIFGYLTDNQNDRTYSIAIIHPSFGSNLCTSYCNYYGNAGTFKPIRHQISPNIPFTLLLYADSNEYHSVCNGNEILKTIDGMTTETYDDVYLFNMNIGNPAKKTEQLSRYFNGDIAYFIISNNNTEIIHLIPCTLTMDLPASMDANNIARAKGTSGMWDLVSDRFYGNVANSGTFKAVNLAEGVDYEVYDWLQGDGSAYIQGIEYDLWNNHLQVSVGKVEYVRGQYYIRYQSNNHNHRFNILFDVANNEDTFVNIFRENSDTYPHIADIQYNSMPDVIEEDFYINNSLFYCLQNGSIRTNNPSQTAIESSWTAIQPQIYSAKMSYIREVLPDSTYKSNLIPVKLLRSIPAKYDANGIARNAGECGMYDTVNDVFYGNVASSGTFSVSDDS